MFISIQWEDLPEKRQFLSSLITAFKKEETEELIHRLYTRFSTSQVDLFYSDSDTWVGACVHWKEDGYRYLDKLFVMEKGYGKKMLDEWLDTRRESYVWRTNEALATHFYSKHSSVYTLFRDDSYVYQAVGNVLAKVRVVESAFLA
jgi:hypothetical protein